MWYIWKVKEKYHMETIGKIYAIVMQCRHNVISVEEAIELIRTIVIG